MKNKHKIIIVLLTLYALCVVTTHYFKSPYLDLFWKVVIVIIIILYLINLRKVIKKAALRHKEHQINNSIKIKK